MGSVAAATDAWCSLPFGYRQRMKIEPQEARFVHIEIVESPDRLEPLNFSTVKRENFFRGHRGDEGGGGG